MISVKHTAAIILMVLGVVQMLYSQNPGMKELREKNIGWAPVMSPKGNATGKDTVIQGRIYTKYQMALIDTFTNWIKQCYVPIGALPQPERLAIPDSKDNKIYLPQGTGVSMWMWDPCFDATGKKIIKAQPASADYITILTNSVPGQTPADGWFNTASQYFFTMYYSPWVHLLNAEDEIAMKPYLDDLKAKIGNYPMYFTGSTINVILTPFDRFPWVQLSQKEVLDEGLRAINQAKQSGKISDEQFARYTDGIDFIRKKHENSLNEPAFITHEQLSIYSFEKDPDLFEPQPSNKYMFPVYRFSPETYQLAKNDKPLWVTVSFGYADSKRRNSTKEIYNAMLNNFNYGYVYNYFFNPEKVKGISYAPRNTDILESNVSKYQKWK